MTSSSRWVQTVPPNKAVWETFYVVVAATVVVVFAAIIIHFNQRKIDILPRLENFEVSARYDLTPSEQGIFADLLLVYEDWLLQPKEIPSSSVDELIDDNWPPFTDKLDHKNRGGHQWQKVTSGRQEGYLGLSQNLTLARHFFWLLPAAREKSSLADFSVWLSSEKTPKLIAPFTPENLTAQGWKKINRNNEIKR